jgi:hypothetical protein
MTAFLETNAWQPQKKGGIDWTKCKTADGVHVCAGVKLQISTWRESLYKDILHLKTRIVTGDIDLGIIVVPSDRLQSFLPDRTPSVSYAKKVIAEHESESSRVQIELALSSSGSTHTSHAC